MTQSSSRPAPTRSSSEFFAAFDALTPEQVRAGGSAKWAERPNAAISAWVAEMDLGTAPAVTAALRRAVDGALFGYMPTPVWQACRAAVIDFHRDSFGWGIPEEDVSPVPDVLSSLRAVISRLTRPGSPVIVPTPAYMPFLTIPGALDREVIEVPALRGDCASAPAWSLDLEAIETAMAAGAGLLMLCNPWNPVGRVLSAAELDAVAALSAKHGVIVFADEIHSSLILPGGARHICYASRPGADPALTFTATSASKGWNMPGLHCAQLIASGEARARFNADPLCSSLPGGASVLGAIASTAALTEGRGWNEAVREYLRGTLEAITGRLNGIDGVSVTMPEATYLTWLDLSAALADGRINGAPAAFLEREAGVSMNEGVTFGSDYATFCRLNLATGRGIADEIADRITAALA
ncbi:aminotransferase class I/II-fold pyridoxal phosphate-dependent enzyme [Actinomyces timonensis]|uniref:cysteine-S-conjugate beta-lyase n=1 Tax=Actinomyces timonensis TaxID=1288391 RepID=A0AAU8N2Z2_9ACTO